MQIVIFFSMLKIKWIVRLTPKVESLQFARKLVEGKNATNAADDACELADDISGGWDITYDTYCSATSDVNATIGRADWDSNTYTCTVFSPIP